MSNLNLKGLWIPIEILTDTNLSDKEKHIYSIVMFLSKEIESRKLIPKMNTPYLTKVKYTLQQNFNTPIEEKFNTNRYNCRRLDKRNRSKSKRK